MNATWRGKQNSKLNTFYWNTGQLYRSVSSAGCFMLIFLFLASHPFFGLYRCAASELLAS